MSKPTMPLTIPLEWRPASEGPSKEGDYLLYNKCDGYHVAECLFDEDGKPDGFIFFGGHPVSRDFYEAWARLPCPEVLFGYFVKD